MRALVIYESMFGNTKQVAAAIAEGLAQALETDLVEVSEAPIHLGDVALLVVGGPTHAFGMSRPQTRRDAAARTGEPLISPGDGIREWLAAWPSADVMAAGPVATATFDTRVRHFPGSAARKAAKQLRHAGARIVDTESFFVTGGAGPLLDGELARARQWGEQLATVAAAAAH